MSDVDRINLPKFKGDTLRIGLFEIANELFKGKTEVSVEYTEYYEMGGSGEQDANEYLNLEEMILVRDHFTRLIDEAKP